jgi:hypothetical protein
LRDRVPNVFHFIFGLRKRPEPFHLVHYLCLASCLEVNAPDAVFVYYRHEPTGRYWRLIEPRVTPVAIDPQSPASRFRYPDRRVKRYRYAHEADFVRLEQLLDTGGVYADIDTVFVNPLPRRLFGESFVLGREGDIVDQRTGRREPSLCNATILAEPGADFGRIWLERMAEAFDGSWSAHSTLLPYRLMLQHPELIHVEPSRTFYKHMWTPEDLNTLFRGLDADFTGVASIHLWSHLWWERRRRDFSDFHAGLITEDYVRAGQTTYAAAARPFLPRRSGPSL